MNSPRDVKSGCLHPFVLWLVPLWIIPCFFAGLVGMRFVATGIHSILGTPVGDDGWSSGVIVSVWLLSKVCRCPQNVKISDGDEPPQTSE